MVTVIDEFHSYCKISSLNLYEYFYPQGESYLYMITDMNKEKDTINNWKIIAINLEKNYAVAFSGITLVTPVDVQIIVTKPKG